MSMFTPRGRVGSGVGRYSEGRRPPPKVLERPPPPGRRPRAPAPGAPRKKSQG